MASPSARGACAAGQKQSPAWRGHFRSQFVKTRLCRFYPTGMCKFGDECAYAHTSEELSEAPDLTKTSMCKAWQEGRCDVPPEECPYAHGQTELRVTPAFVQKKLSRRTREAAGKDDVGGETSTEKSTEPGSPTRRYTGFSLASSGPSSPATPAASPLPGYMFPATSLGSVDGSEASPRRSPHFAPLTPGGKSKPVLCLSDILVAEVEAVRASPTSSPTHQRTPMAPPGCHLPVGTQASFRGLGAATPEGLSPFPSLAALGAPGSPLASPLAGRASPALFGAGTPTASPKLPPPGVFKAPSPAPGLALSPASLAGLASPSPIVSVGCAPGLGPPPTPPGKHEVVRRAAAPAPAADLGAPWRLEAGFDGGFGTPDYSSEELSTTQDGSIESILFAARQRNMPIRVKVGSMGVGS